MSKILNRVFIIQCLSNGLFMTDDLGYTKSFKAAARSMDYQDATDTGVLNLGNDFEIHSFYELDNVRLIR